jgi:putative flippase GtrA
LALLDVRLAKFLLVGLANTTVGLAVILSAKSLAGADDVSANVAGYAVGLTLSFALNQRWTFGFRGDVRASLLRFLAVFAVAYAANLVAVLSLIEVLSVNAYWAQVLGVIPYTLLFYVGSRWYAFSPSTHRGHGREPG